MCGRYSLGRKDTPWAFAEVRVEWDGRPRYNVGPLQKAPVVRRRGGRHVVDELRWGLVPPWARDDSGAARAINARSEGVAETRLFREAFRLRRCLVPADAFYEWETEQGRRLPWRIHRTDGQPFLMAGLWDSCANVVEGEGTLETFTVLTTAANDDVRPIHDRMPVLLTGDAAAVWLAEETSPEILGRLCVSAPKGTLSRHRVSPRMNSVQYDGPECAEPVMQQGSLF